MVQRSAMVVTVAAVILGVVAIALSFVAYGKRIKIADVGFTGGLCSYPSSPSFGLGIVAALFLLLEQIVISVGTGCFCCRGNPCPSSCGAISSLILFIVSWLAFIVAFMGLLFTAIVNYSVFLSHSYPGTSSVTSTSFSDAASTAGDAAATAVTACYIGKDNLFLGAAIWCIISVVLGLIAHIVLNATSGNNGIRQGNGNFANEQGVAMGQPQAPFKGQK